jgi:hypothetical protein
VSWYDIGEGMTLDRIVNEIREAQEDGRIHGEIFTVTLNIDNGYVRADVHFAPETDSNLVEHEHVTLEIK